MQRLNEMLKVDKHSLDKMDPHQLREALDNLPPCTCHGRGRSGMTPATLCLQCLLRQKYSK